MPKWFRPHLDQIQLDDNEQAMCERLRQHIDVLAELIGERHVFRYQQLQAAHRYVRDQLSATNLAVTEQCYDVFGKSVANIIAEQPGGRRRDEIVIVGAHYDSVSGTPGADDNASAVACLIETAHQLSKRQFQRTLRFVSFVNEEPPFYKGDDMGSLRYAKQCQHSGDNIVGMINYEMMGYFDDGPNTQLYPGLGRIEKSLPKRGNFIVLCSNFSSWKLLARLAWGFKRSVKFPMLPFAAPRKVSGPDMSDNWSFWQCGYPAIMVTDTSFLRNNNYHKSSDRLQTLNLPAMTRVAKGMIGAIGRLAKPAK